MWPEVPPGTVQEFTAGETASVYLEMRDVYGNVPSIDFVADVAIKYALQPNRDVLLATLSPNPDENVRNANAERMAFKATRQLTILGIYVVTARVLGVNYCVASYFNATAGLCIPNAIVSPEKSLASVSLLQGSGTVDAEAGDAVQVKVIPLDRFGNQVTFEHSFTELKYAMNVTMMASLNPAVPDGTIYVLNRPLTYNIADNSHGAFYSLTAAGLYSLAVDMLEPRWYVEQTYLVTRRALPINLVASVADVRTTEVIVPQATASAQYSVRVLVRDRYQNLVRDDLTSVLAVHIVGPTVLTSEQGLVILEYNADSSYDAFFQTPTAGLYQVTAVIDGTPTSAVPMTVSGGLPLGATSAADGAGLRGAVAGVPTSFDILPFDQFGNQRDLPGGDWRVTLFLETGTGIAKTVTQVTPLLYVFGWSAAKEAYNVTYAVRTAGTLLVYTTLGPIEQGDHIDGSPFRVAVIAGPVDPTTCIIRGVGLNGVLVGMESEFKLQARDAFNNDISKGGDPFRVEANREGTALGSITIGLTDNMDGTYTARFSATGVGRYVVRVFLNGEH
eukprot:9498106-Pyramimonas_sp.AAC.1